MIENLKKNCLDDPCKYHHYCVDPQSNFWCSLHDCEIPDDIDETGCKDFELARTCIDCKHRKTTIYETGTIDDIEYRCPFQDGKLIYDDINPGVSHYADVPTCNINKFELL